MRPIEKVQKCWLIQNISLVLVFCFTTSATAQNADPVAPISIGMSASFSGPTKSLGESMRRGIQSYFQSINAQGGIHGRPLKLIALDDGYNPVQAAENTRRLIKKEQVLALIGNVGTPTAMVTVPIANREKTLLFGAFTGANILRQDPPSRYVINFRASYEEETATMINGLLDAGIKADEIAFFTQNDGYGDAGYQGALKALKKRGYNEGANLSHGRYTRNTLNVEDGLLHILDAKKPPKAIVMVATYAASAKFISFAKQILPNTAYLNVSFVGSMALSEALGAYRDKVIITQVVPHFDSDLAGIKAYRADLKTYNNTTVPDFVSLEGYLAAKVFVAGLKRAQLPLTRESLIDGLESIQKLDIGIGPLISYSKTEHNALHQVWPTQIRDNAFVSLKPIDLQTN